MRRNVLIVGAVRTPIGAIGGGLASFQAESLDTHAIRALLDATVVDPAVIESKLEVVRDGKKIELEIELQERPTAVSTG